MCVWDKEVRYFSRGPEAGADLCWYRRLYPCVPAGSPHVGFDGSPDYLVMGDAKIRTMAATLPHAAKLIFLLRDPAARFYSAYNMGMNEHLRNFGRRRNFEFAARGGGGRNVLWVPADDAVDDANRTADLGETHAENLGGNLGGHDRNARRADYDAFASSLDRYISCAPTCADEPSVVAMFFDHGMYARHLRVYASHFSWSRMLILRSEDLFADSWTVTASALQFAEIPILAEHEAHVRSKMATGKVKANDGAKWGVSGEGYRGSLRCAEWAKLARFYRAHNAELFRLIGRDMRWEEDHAERSGCGKAEL